MKKKKDYTDYAISRCQMAELRSYLGLRKIEKGQRKCLKCGQEFVSEDLKINKMCASCRNVVKSITGWYV